MGGPEGDQCLGVLFQSWDLDGYKRRLGTRRRFYLDTHIKLPDFTETEEGPKELIKNSKAILLYNKFLQECMEIAENGGLCSTRFLL